MRFWIVGFVFLLIVLNVSILSAREASPLEGYLEDEESINNFIELEGADRNELWESGDAIDRGAMINQIIEERVNKKQANFEIQRSLFKSSAYHYFDNGGTIPEVYGVQVDINNYGEMKQFAKDNFGMDLDSQVSNIKEMKGLGSADLSWSENGENIIGKNGLWLDLDNPPFGTESIEYDGENFVLSMKNGGKIVVTPGSTNDKGELTFLSKGSDARSFKMFQEIFESESKTPVIDALKAVGKDLTTPNMKEIVTKDLLTGNFGLGNFEVLDENAEVILNPKGFDIGSPDTTVKYGEMTFGSGSGVDGAEGGMGVEGDGAGIGNGDEGAGIGEGEEGGGLSAGRGGVGKKSSVKFEGDRIVLENIDFQRNGYVKIKAQDEMIVKFGDTDLPVGKNVVNMNGENIVVQGEGEVELLRNINSLVGVDCGEEGFVVRAGDMVVEFKGDELKIPTVLVERAFLIDDIRLVNNGELVGKPYKMIYESEKDGFVLTESDRIVVGRNTLLGPYGMSVDASIALGTGKWLEINEAVNAIEGKSAEKAELFVEKMMDSDFAFRIDTHVPVGGFDVAGESIIERKNQFISNQLGNLLSQVPSEGLVIPKEKTIQSIQDIVTNSIDSLSGRRLNPDEPAVLLQNNPGGNPSIVLLFEDGTREVVQLEGNDAKLVGDTLSAIVQYRSVTQQVIGRNIIGDVATGGLKGLILAGGKLWLEKESRDGGGGGIFGSFTSFAGKMIIGEEKLPLTYKKSLYYQNIGQALNIMDKIDLRKVLSGEGLFDPSLRPLLSEHLVLKEGIFQEELKTMEDVEGKTEVILKQPILSKVEPTPEIIPEEISSLSDEIFEITPPVERSKVPESVNPETTKKVWDSFWNVGKKVIGQ